MTVTRLTPDQVAALRAQPFSYSAVGATMSDPPTGFQFFVRTHVVNPQDFDAASQALMSWQVQRRAGLKVAASLPRVSVDSLVVMRLGLGALALRIPCRVVYVVNEPDIQGFAYGTLTGHPESGEEAFLLRRGEDGRVEFTISAFSKPSSLLARAGGPISRRIQYEMTTRYLLALDR